MKKQKENKEGGEGRGVLGQPEWNKKSILQSK